MSVLERFFAKNEVLKLPLFRRYLSFRLFLIGALNMQITILAYWIYDISHDVRLVGELGLWEAIPAIGCSFFSGHFVDQKEKRNLLLGCSIVYILIALFFCSLSVLHGNGELSTNVSVRLVFLGILVGGVVRSFIGPSTFSILGLLVKRDLLPTASAWSSTSWYIGSVLGPLVGGLLIGAIGVKLSLAWVAGILLLPFLAMLFIPKQEIMKKDKEPIMKSLKQGLRFVFKTPVILSVLSLDMFAVLFGGAVALLPVYAKDILKVGEMGFGIMRAAPGFGAIIMMLILSFMPLEKKPGIKLLFAIAGFGICMIIFGISTSFALSVAMLVLGGMFDAVSVMIRGIILQLNTPDDMRGRVAAVNTMFISSSNELGEVESGYTAAWMGTVNSVVFGGSMTLAVVVFTFLLVPSLRALKLKK
ncbi:MAG TPA: MFS transporter [Chitinophagaceae bacterium]|nr:MFS transporter [Chitinophagaceae bacterium]